MRSALPWTVDSGDFGLRPRSRPSAAGALRRGSRAPAPRSSRSLRSAAAAHKRAASGGSSRSSSSARRAAAASRGRNRRRRATLRAPCGPHPFHARAVVGVNRIEPAQAEHRLGIESERIGLQAVDRGDRDAARAASRRRRGRGRSAGSSSPGHRARRSRSSRVSREAPGHRLQAQPEARRDRRRTTVAARAGDQHLRRAERACEIVRRQADAKFEPRQPRFARIFGASHGSGAGEAGHTPSLRPPRTINRPAAGALRAGPR